MSTQRFLFPVFLLALVLLLARPAAAQKFHRAGRSNNSPTLHSYNPNGNIKRRDAKKPHKTAIDKHIGAVRRKDQRLARKRRARQGPDGEAPTAAP